jgi:hypothetical protein
MITKIFRFMLASVVCVGLTTVVTSCQDKDIEMESMKMVAPSADQISGQLQGDDYVLTWPAQTGKMQVSIYRNGTINSTEIVEGTSYTHRNVPTNVPFEYVFKLTDGTNFSKGVVKQYTRPGATSITGVQMRQIEKAGGYDAEVT